MVLVFKTARQHDLPGTIAVRDIQKDSQVCTKQHPYIPGRIRDYIVVHAYRTG